MRQPERADARPVQALATAQIGIAFTRIAAEPSHPGMTSGTRKRTRLRRRCVLTITGRTAPT
jgi:hypothetical protein